jgi:NADH dehydrogenase
MILVIGATGMLGQEICRRLSEKGLPVRAMVRKTSAHEKVNKLKELGIQIAEGDLRDPSTFESALKGCSTVITTVSAMPFSYVPAENDIQNVDLQGMKSLIDEAKSSGVKRFIYTSFSGNIDEEFPLRNAKREVEQYLRDSKLVYTILRPSCFIEVWLTAAVGFDVENAKVQICGDGNKPVSYISYKDVATFAVECLDNPHARNTSLELGGPEKISQLDAVRIFEKASGKHFEIMHIPVGALESQMKSAPDPMQASFSGLMLCLAHGDPIDMSETLKKYPVKLVAVKDYATQMTTVH